MFSPRPLHLANRLDVLSSVVPAVGLQKSVPSKLRATTLGFRFCGGPVPVSESAASKGSYCARFEAVSPWPAWLVVQTPSRWRGRESRPLHQQLWDDRDRLTRRSPRWTCPASEGVGPSATRPCENNYDLSGRKSKQRSYQGFRSVCAGEKRCKVPQTFLNFL